MDSPLHVLAHQLIAAFPDTYPSYTLSEREFAFRAGQVDIVRRLQTALSSHNIESDLDLSLPPRS
jgi:hypothetical protein